MANRQVYDNAGNVIASEWYPDPPKPALMPVDIVALFTIGELSAIELSTALAVIAFRVQFMTAVNPIALDDPRFIAAVGVMRSNSILNETRAAEVLAGVKQQP